MTGVGLENSHRCRTVQTDTLNFREVNLLRGLDIFTDRKHFRNMNSVIFFLWWCDGVDEERGISRICRRLLWWADVLVTFHEVFTGQGNSKLLPVRTFDVDVLQITFHLFEDTNSNDCAISLGTFAWNAPWHLRIFSSNRKYNFGAKWQSPWWLWIL